MIFKRMFLLLLAVPMACMAAGFDDFISVSWNMQGAFTNGQSNWATSVTQFINPNRPGGAADIVALQEAGAFPGSARLLNGGPLMAQTFVVGTFPTSWTNINVTISEYTWNGYYIYHLAIGTPGFRNNLAIVSRYRANNVVLVPPLYDNGGTYLSTRPAMGIEVQNPLTGEETTFYTFHAGAYPTNETPNLLQLLGLYHNPNSGFDPGAPVQYNPYTNIQQNGIIRRLYGGPISPSFAILGDFNRDILGRTDAAARTIVRVPANLALVRTYDATHVNLGTAGDLSELDYAVAGNFAQQPPNAFNLAPYVGNQLNDHLNVNYLPAPPPVTPAPLTAPPTAALTFEVPAHFGGLGTCSHGRCLTGTVAVGNAGTTLTTSTNNQITNAVTVTLVDSGGNPVPNVPVQFMIVAGSGNLRTPAGQTDGNGKFTSLVDSVNKVANASVAALFDSSGQGTANSPVLNGAPTAMTFSFATGG